MRKLKFTEDGNLTEATELLRGRAGIRAQLSPNPQTSFPTSPVPDSQSLSSAGEPHAQSQAGSSETLATCDQKRVRWMRCGVGKRVWSAPCRLQSLCPRGMASLGHSRHYPAQGPGTCPHCSFLHSQRGDMRLSLGTHQHVNKTRLRALAQDSHKETLKGRAERPGGDKK